MSTEGARIELLVRRDGVHQTREWVLRTLEIYRSAVANRGSHASLPEYRALFGQAIREYERWLASNIEPTTDREDEEPMRLERAFVDPGAVFRSPRELLQCDRLSRDQKIALLRRWEYEAREPQVAAEESMPRHSPVQLQEILDALHELGAGTDTERAPLTRHGAD